MSQYNDFYGGGGGGGYVAGSPYGGANSPGGFGRKSETSHSLRPMTIHQLLSANQAHADADWMLDDTEIGQVTIVAHIASVQVQATNSQYILDDGSGRIEVRRWIDSSVEDESEKLGIVEGVYVRVLGSLKMFGNKKYINATHIRPVSSPAEIYFHVLEAMTVTLIWERGPPPRPGQSPQEGVPKSSVYSAQPVQSTDSEQYAHLPKLHRAIVAFMQKQPPSEVGVHVGAIARAVGGDAVSISDALDKLSDEGLAFSTIDESHYQLAT
ncbi:replication protein A subunit RPA32 [Pisolithus marmoratus]|nr:replication protein A subunit RPA32 [Pisolithus marmoratus]